MNRTEIEIKLNQERAWTLETWAAMPPDDLARGITTSKHDPQASWSAKDHLAHLAGIEAAFNGIVRRHLAGDPNPIGIKGEFVVRPSGVQSSSFSLRDSIS